MKRYVWIVMSLIVIAMMLGVAWSPAYARPQSKQDKNWNLAYGMPVKASGFDKGFLPEYAVDGLFDPHLTPPDCWRRSGEGPNWIEVTFAGKARIEQVGLLIGRGAPGIRFDFTARLSNGKFDKLGSFAGKPDANGIVSFDIPKSQGNVVGVRFDMLDPGFPCIFEIEVNGRIPEITPIEVPPLACLAGPDIIFYNAVVNTMDPDFHTYKAIAIFGDRIDALGSTEEVLALATECTELIDVQGRTIMPGFVDTHSHILEHPDLGDTMEERQDFILRNGVTTIGHLHTSPEALAAISAFNAEGKLKVRTGIYMVYNGNCDQDYGRWFMAHPATRHFGEMLRINGVKMFADGTEISGCEKLPYLSVPVFPDTPEDPDPLEPYGDRYLSASEIAEIAGVAQSLNLQVAIHAVGDAAIDDALDGIEAALDGRPNTYRHRIEHNAVIRPDQYERYGDIGIVATLPTPYQACDPFGPPLPDEYLGWEWPFRALVDANAGSEAHFVWQADAPLHPQNPFHALFGYVTAIDLDDTGAVCEAEPPFANPPSWIADNLFTVQEGLRFMTTESAYALFRETEVGSLEVGKLADLVVVSGNPFVLPPEVFKDINILATLVGGAVRYCADGAESLCP